MKPKPLKQERINNKKQKEQELLTYRQVQKAVAMLRDNYQCTFCKFLHDKDTRAVDGHHVYGRGKDLDAWQEGYQYILSSCRECHPQPIKVPGGNLHLAYVEEVMEKANRTPINKLFSSMKES